MNGLELKLKRRSTAIQKVSSDEEQKKIIFNGVFLAVVFALTIYGVFHGEDLSSMMDAIHRADKRWLLPGIALVAFFIWGNPSLSGI